MSTFQFPGSLSLVALQTNRSDFFRSRNTTLRAVHMSKGCLSLCSCMCSCQSCAPVVSICSVGCAVLAIWSCRIVCMLIRISSGIRHSARVHGGRCVRILVPLIIWTVWVPLCCSNPSRGFPQCTGRFPCLVLIISSSTTRV